MNNTNAVSGKASKDGSVPVDTPVSREQRQALVWAHQARSLQQQNPLVANLGVISGDLMSFAHGLAPALQSGIERGLTSAESHRGFTHLAEFYLKVVRQIDRLAQIERQLSAPAGEQEKGG